MNQEQKHTALNETAEVLDNGHLLIYRPKSDKKYDELIETLKEIKERARKSDTQSMHNLRQTIAKLYLLAEESLRKAGAI